MARNCMIFACLVLPHIAAVTPTSATDPPNILIIMADDCTFNDLSINGGRTAKTPHLDTLAREGLTFNHAYVASAMCQPCRAELFTGLYPMRNGCAWNHSASLPTTRSLPHHLQKLGYRVGLAGKVHVSPASVFPFEHVDGFDHVADRNPTRKHDLLPVADFINRDPDQPFCLVVALVEPHIPWVMGDASAYPPDEIDLPPNLADTTRTREAFSRYLAEITFMDRQVGELLKFLDDSGYSNQTLVMFTSEQGSQFPGNKWTNWDTGLHTTLIAKWPGRILPNTRSDALVQYADIVPTLIDVAGGIFDEDKFDGESFLTVLKGEAHTHRKFVYGLHNNIPEGPPYPIRTISNGSYRLIRNLLHDNVYIEKHMMGIVGDTVHHNPCLHSWIWNSSTSPRSNLLVQRFLRRPAETLHHTKADPHELKNIIHDPSFAAIRQKLSEELDAWLISQRDTGTSQDSWEWYAKAKREK